MNRPASVTVFGVLNLAFALFGLCGAAMSVPILTLHSDAQSGDAVTAPFLEHPWYLAYTKASIVVGGGVILLLAASGVGLLLMKNWGRRAAVLYAASAIVLNGIGLLLESTFYVPSLLEHTRTMPEGPVRTGIEIGARVSLIVTAVGGLGYPIVLLVFATRRKVVEAFSPAPPAAN
jgi:hypothetical protein